MRAINGIITRTAPDYNIIQLETGASIKMPAQKSLEVYDRVKVTYDFTESRYRYVIEETEEIIHDDIWITGSDCSDYTIL
jgi:hypothetical protein